MSEDDLWLEALAGRIDSSPTGPASLREALALRALIRAQSADAESVALSIDPDRESMLIARARAADLLPRPAVRTPRRFIPPRLAAAAAAALLVAVGVGLWQSFEAPPRILRGAPNGVVRLQSRNPPALKQELLSELAAAGVTVSGYERLGRIGIDADLPQPVPAPIVEILSRHHIPIPTDGVLIVEFESIDR
jgi:hypothetical protein